MLSTSNRTTIIKIAIITKKPMLPTTNCAEKGDSSKV